MRRNGFHERVIDFASHVITSISTRESRISAQKECDGILHPMTACELAFHRAHKAVTVFVSRVSECHYCSMGNKNFTFGSSQGCKS